MSSLARLGMHALAVPGWPSICAWSRDTLVGSSRCRPARRSRRETMQAVLDLDGGMSSACASFCAVHDVDDTFSFPPRDGLLLRSDDHSQFDLQLGVDHGSDHKIFVFFKFRYLIPTLSMSISWTETRESCGGKVFDDLWKLVGLDVHPRRIG